MTAKPIPRMTRLIRGYGYDGVSLAKVLGCSPPTARRKLLEPQYLTVGDLDKLRRSGHIPLEEIKEALVG